MHATPAFCSRSCKSGKSSKSIMKYIIFWLCLNDCENDIIIQERFSMPETFSMFKYHRKISRSPLICISFFIKTMISVFFNLVLKMLISDLLLRSSIMVQISRDQKQFWFEVLETLKECFSVYFHIKFCIKCC